MTPPQAPRPLLSVPTDSPLPHKSCKWKHMLSVLCVWLLSLSIVFSKFILVSEPPSSSWPSNIPPFGWTAFCVSTHQVRNVWWLLPNRLCKRRSLGPGRSRKSGEEAHNRPGHAGEGWRGRRGGQRGWARASTAPSCDLFSASSAPVNPHAGSGNWAVTTGHEVPAPPRPPGARPLSVLFLAREEGL